MGMMAFYIGVPVKGQFEWDMLLKLDSVNEHNVLEAYVALSVRDQSMQVGRILSVVIPMQNSWGESPRLYGGLRVSKITSNHRGKARLLLLIIVESFKLGVSSSRPL